MTMRLCTTLLALSVCLPGLAHAQVSGMASAGIASPGIGIIGRGGILIPLPAPNRPPQPFLAAPPATGRLPQVIVPRVIAPQGTTRPALLVLQGPGQQCRQAIQAAERSAALPAQLMAAIARVESGRPDAQGGVHPWPWTINAEGVGHYYETKAEAIAAVRALQARGVRSVDVGCMQVNLLYHPDAFAPLEQASDPVANARYAAGFLPRLYAQTHDWAQATANYHSASPALGGPYQRKVAAVLPDEMRHANDPAAGQPNVWSVNAWSANAWNTGAPPAFAGRAGGFMLSTGSARIIRLPQGATGRGLAAYRSAPVPVVASR